MVFKNSGRSLSVHDASKALYFSAEALEPIIRRFVNDDILEVSPEDAARFRYSPKSNATKKAIDELERVYNQQRVNVITLIFTGSINTFADAFKLKREEDE